MNSIESYLSDIKFKYEMEDRKPIFTTASDSQVTTTESLGAVENGNVLKNQDCRFSPLAPPFQSRVNNDILAMMSQQEPCVADTAPQTTDIDEMLMNLRMNGPDMFDDMEPNNGNNYFLSNRSDSESMASTNLWRDGSTTARNGEMIDTFDFLIKSLSSANNYVSMLTREQLCLLRSIRPSLLYELLQEIAKVRSDKRQRRALPNECAFCKNNGENEECYSSHALKDWRGRVLCPVLRAFRCPRCGATGDRAHTIKYCPENADGGLERSGSSLSRRRMPGASPLVFGAGGRPMQTAAPATPATSPSPGLNPSNIWSNFGIN